jgi:hypothetical protein
MEAIIDIISFLILIALCACIFFLTRKIQGSTLRFKFLWFLGISYSISLLFIVLFAGWLYYSNRWQMEYYGCDFSIGLPERFGNVAPENVDRVEQLDISTHGLAWPLRAIMTHDAFILYMLVAYSMYYLIRIKMNKIYPKSDNIV